MTYKVLIGKPQEKWQFVKLDVNRQPLGQSLTARFFGTQWQAVLLHENRKILGHIKNYQSRSSSHNQKTSAKSPHNKWTSLDLHPKQCAPVHVSECVDIYIYIYVYIYMYIYIYVCVKHTLTHRNQTVVVGCGWINLLITVKRKTDWWCKLPWMAINGQERQRARSLVERTCEREYTVEQRADVPVRYQVHWRTFKDQFFFSI